MEPQPSPLPPLHLLRVSAPVADGGKRSRSAAPPQETQPRPFSDIFSADIVTIVDRYLAGNDEDVAPLCHQVTAWCIAKGKECTDDTYRQAIGAFGFVPQHDAQPLYPFPASELGGWRTLFLSLCDAFYAATKSSGEHSDTMWRLLSNRLILDHSQGISLDRYTLAYKLLRRDSLTQRALDKFYDALFIVWLTNFAPDQDSKGNLLNRWDKIDMFDDPPFGQSSLLNSPTPFSALWVLLRMRGAQRRPRIEYYPNEIDAPMYEAITEGIRGWRAWTAVVETTKRYLTLGANVFYSQAQQPGMPKLPLPSIEDSVTLLELAVLSRRADLVLLLFKGAASEFAPLRLIGAAQGAEYGSQIMAILSEGLLEGERKDVEAAHAALANAIYENVAEDLSWIDSRISAQELNGVITSIKAFATKIVEEFEDDTTANQFLALAEQLENLSAP